jgi:hypothetical protein
MDESLLAEVPIDALRDELTRLLIGKEEETQAMLDPDWIQAMSVLDVERARSADVRLMPENNNDLHEYVHAYLGLDIPHTAVCNNHVAPFSFIADAFFERQNYVLGWANRTGGKTINTGALHHLNMFLKREIAYDVVCIGAVKEQALKMISYVKNLSEIKWFHSDCLYRYKHRIGYRGGGNIEVLAGTMAGVNSPHPICAAFDEVELMSGDVIEEAYSMPLSKGPYPASMIMTSTRKFPTGRMQMILHRIKFDPSYPFKAYPWCVFETLKNCGDNDCEVCKKAVRLNAQGNQESFFDVCGKRGKEASGFYQLTDVLSKFALMDADVFDAQWLCLKPGRSLLVFKSFDADVHQKNFPIPWLSEDKDERARWKPYILMDMGWTDPLCVLIVGVDVEIGAIFVVDELYQSEIEKSVVAEWLEERYVLYHFHERFANEKVIVHTDNHDPRSITEFRNDHGIWCWPVSAPIMGGLRALRPYFDAYITRAHPPIWFHARNVKAVVGELGTYKWPKDKVTGKATGEQPAKGQPDHGIDLLRYLMNLLGKIAGIGQVVVITEKESLTPAPNPPTSSRWTRNRLASDKWRHQRPS